jgi:hypothetical protein
MADYQELLLFDKAAGALPWEGLVVSTGLLCSVGREASQRQQHCIVWSLGISCVCGSRLLALSSKLRVPWGRKASGLELSSAHKIVEALGSTCVGEWASKSHSS